MLVCISISGKPLAGSAPRRVADPGAGMAGIMLLPATHTSPRNCWGLCFQETLNNSSCTLEAPINTCLALTGVICTGYWQQLLQQVLIKNTQAFPAQTSIHTAFCALHNSSCLTFSSRANEIVESGKCACVSSPWGPGLRATPSSHERAVCVVYCSHAYVCLAFFRGKMYKR